MSENLKKIQAIKKKVKNGKLKFQHKDIKAQLLKDVKITSKEREQICKDARAQAHTIVADTKRDMSNEIRKHTHTLSEGYDFIEESFGTGNPDFTFYEEPQESATISEAFEDGNKYGMIGVAEGVFAPIGVMSRNNRIYDEDHYDYVLDNELLKNKIIGRGMLGTIGHHDKRVDDEDLASGNVSHIVTDLHIQEEADGTRNLVGRLEIMDTPAGRLLKTYYDHGVPLYVSSRGAGRLLNVANESYKRVDKTNYFLETFDIVKDPGFLQAKPNYVKESLEEENTELDNTTIGENNMENEKVIPAIDTKMEAEEIVSKLLHPLQEQLAELTETVKLLSDKVLDEAEEVVEEVEVKEETVSEEVVSEEKKAEEAEKLEADAEEDEAKADKLKKDAKEDKEEIEEAKAEEVSESVEEVSEEACPEPKKETEENEDEKAIADPVKEEAEVAEVVEEEVSEEKVEEKCEPKKETEENEDEKAIKEEAEVVEEVSEEKAEDKEELKADEKEDKAEAKKLEADAEEDKEDAEEIKEECGCHKHHEEEKEDEEEKKEECDESAEVIEEPAKEEVSESVEKTINDLVKMVADASGRYKELIEKHQAVEKELHAYKLSEELSITIDEAKEKLEAKSYEEIKEEAKVEEKAEEIVEEVKEEKVEEAVEEVQEETVVESKKAVKPVFSRFSNLSESKKSSRKGFSIFG